MSGPRGQFMGWFDPDKQKTPLDKLIGAVERYEDKYDETPTAALVNPADFAKLPEIEDVRVEPRPYVAVNVFYVGHDT